MGLTHARVCVGDERINVLHVKQPCRDTSESKLNTTCLWNTMWAAGWPWFHRVKVIVTRWPAPTSLKRAQPNMYIVQIKTYNQVHEQTYIQTDIPPFDLCPCDPRYPDGGMVFILFFVSVCFWSRDLYCWCSKLSVEVNRRKMENSLLYKHYLEFLVKCVKITFNIKCPISWYTQALICKHVAHL